MRAFIVGALTLLAAASPASAEWQFTNWGMSVDEVVAASGGSVERYNGSPGQRIMGSNFQAKGSYSAGGYDFESEFYFDPSGRLSVIRLMLIDYSQCGSMREMMQGIYGSSAEGGLFRETQAWYDSDRGNVVRTTQVGGMCFIAYTPLRSSGTRDF